MPLQETSGNATVDAYGGGVAVAPVYIEDVMSTFLYTGTGANQTITNGIDLAGKGGLVWIKDRTTSYNHTLADTVRGANNVLITNTTGANISGVNAVTGFNSNGFNLGFPWGSSNTSGDNYASWTFRKQPKFFDVVTYTGTGANTTIAHNLGSVPGCIIVKRTDTTGNWRVYHNSLTSAAYGVQLNSTSAQASDTTLWNSTAPTTSVFSVGTNVDVNASGGTYVAYLFAHNAGGFGLTGTDNVISCGSYTGTGAAGNAVTLGYEPQMVFIKCTSSTGNWYMVDTMRGFADLQFNPLFANLSNAEAVNSGTQYMTPTATGFTLNGTSAGFNGASATYIYIAIRRGPMKVPTDGTKVFAPLAQNASTNAVVSTNFPVDLNISAERSRLSFPYTLFIDRLRGSSLSSSTLLASQSTNAESNFGTASGIAFDSNTSVVDNLWSGTYGAADSISYYNLRRAPGFFDEVCYTGTGGSGNRNINHNLGVVPELMIAKARSRSGDNWPVYCSALGSSGWTLYLNLNLQKLGGGTPGGVWYQNPTATTFSIESSASSVNDSGVNYVWYGFASCPGVSKVGSYTGNGSTQTINCGFAGGARFVLIKRTDSTGDWYVYDTARGMTTLTDPYLLLNSTAAESATLGSVTSVTTGFAVNAAILAAINTNGASYIYLSIA